MNFDAYAPTAKAEQEGSWFLAADVFRGLGFVAEDDPAQIRLAAAGAANPQFQRRITRELRRMKKDLKDLEYDDMLTPQQRAVAETVVLGWAGFTDSEGREIPYSPEYMMEVFQKYPPTYEAIRKFVDDRDNFRLEQVAEAAKN